MATSVLKANFLTQELRSESTLPLLNLFLQLGHDATADQVNDKLHALTVSIGKEERPIPDESEQLQTALLQLMANGVPKVDDNPTVSLVYA